MQHIESMPPGQVEPLFAPSAHLIQTDGGERSDKSKSGRKRKQQWKRVGAHGHAGDDNTDDRIDHADEDDVARHGLEIVDAGRERTLKIAKSDLADRRKYRTGIRTSDDVKIRHRIPPITYTSATIVRACCFGAVAALMLLHGSSDSWPDREIIGFTIFNGLHDFGRDGRTGDACCGPAEFRHMCCVKSTAADRP